MKIQKRKVHQIIVVAVIAGILLANAFAAEVLNALKKEIELLKKKLIELRSLAIKLKQNQVSKKDPEQSKKEVDKVTRRQDWVGRLIATPYIALVG